MCIAGSPSVTAPANTQPTMQSATALQLGGAAGVPRGSANLGRLMLRNPGASATGASSTASSTTGSSAVAPIAPSASQVGSPAAPSALALRPGQVGAGGDAVGGVPTNEAWVTTNNPGLRFTPSSGQTFSKV